MFGNEQVGSNPLEIHCAAVNLAIARANVAISGTPPFIILNSLM